MFTNTGSVSKTKRRLTYRMGQKLSSKLLFISSPKIDGFLFHKAVVKVWWHA